MTQSLVYRDVWHLDDANAKTDAIAFWKRTDALQEKIDAQERAGQLCVIAYDGDTTAGVATVNVRRLDAVRADMAFLRAFVAPEYRSQKIVIQLADAVHAAIERYALQNPELRIGGTAAVVTAVPAGFRPHGTNMTMCGFTPAGDPIIIRWFDHYRI